MTSFGSKMGFHLQKPNITLGTIRKWVAAGIIPKVVISLQAGTALEVKAVNRSIITIYRYLSPNANWVGLQNIQDWSVDQVQTCVKALVQQYFDKTSPAERAQTDYVQPGINEADPKGFYRAYGLFLCALCQEAHTRGVKLAIPAFNAGTPEWLEMQAMAETGLFGLMKEYGFILLFHEGVFGDDPVDDGYSSRIPDAPVVVGSGSLCFRLVFLYTILQDRQEVIPCVVSEFVDGGGYTQTPTEHLIRFAWYDRLACALSYIIGFCGFTVDPEDNWQGASFNDFYTSDILFRYLLSQKDIPNGDHMTTDFDAIRTHALAGIVELQAILSELPVVPPAPWWTTYPTGLLNPSRKTVPNSTSLSLYYQASGTPFVVRTVDPAHYSVDVYERQADFFRVTNGSVTIWVQAEALQPF